MKPLLLIIRKKREVPTINQRIHKTKIIWQQVYRIDYSQSPQLLYLIDGRGTIVNDAQFSAWLVSAFGYGEYHILAWQKGREGFWSFLRVICDENGFMRLKRKDKTARKELQGYKDEIRQLKMEQDSSDDPEIKMDLQKEIENYENAVKSINDEESSNPTSKYGTAGYLKGIQPIYKPHFYQDYRSLP